MLAADVGVPGCPDLIVIGALTTDLDAGLATGLAVPYEGDTAPAGWHLCDGSAHGSAALRAHLGSDFAPDFRDRFIVAAGREYARGATGGAASVALSVAEVPVHDHSVGWAADSGVVDGNIYSTAANPTTVRFQKGGPYGMAGGAGAGLTGDRGGGQAHENRPPYYALVWIIKK